MIYLDNSATTAPSEEVLSSFSEVNRRFYANPASLHRAGKDAESLLDRSREQILSIVGASDGEVIFTSGGTEANNLALFGFARKLVSRGMHIITTIIEHPSILYAAQQLEKEGFEVDYLSVDEDGLISIDELRNKLREDTTVVSIMHVNNEVGTIQPIEECAKVIKENSRALFHSDTIQSFGKLSVTLGEGGPDAISVSAHKIHGLKASGALITRKRLKPMAINYGGGQEFGIRSGTVSVPDAAALARAMRLVNENNKAEQYEQWRNRLINYIKGTKDVIIISKENSAPHILSIAFHHIKGEVAVNYFQENGIIISTSSACSSKSGRAGHVIDAIRLSEKYKHGVIRISFGNNTTDEHIEEFEKVFTDFTNLLERGKTYEME
ncbi:cysteine desulfurase family protein [Sporosarcina sp. G11-34]|uniref:cysteine desulfurase family protein n=1 Tax=Sporosarcina sp. G11-34 TaxID=2849605 RepID=UPI0022A8E4E5|nr:cysteine desulfurase family protein [Sporosarcina sp. G11-34]MCZ2259725.1 cysteine desulfurase [Sporosarcina sp. G11-34]